MSLRCTHSLRNNCKSSLRLFRPSSEVTLKRVIPGIEGSLGKSLCSLSCMVLNSEYLFSIFHVFWVTFDFSSTK